ncbi:MAG: hypothetical protein K2N38_09635 [Oscillospiraceae bacterium]|nr:hypothetical protein [Oscillospiraceae bacterium]
MEKLAALCCLWAFGLADKDDYYSELDRLFLENPEDDLLLELEGLGDDRAEAWARLGRLARSSLNIDIFGKELFAALEKVYNENRVSLAKFGELCHEMWRELTADFWDDEPFYSLSYAYLPLDEYGDEKQTREFFQKAFDYYKEKP